MLLANTLSSKNTRIINVGYALIKTEYTRKGFFYVGAKIFNELPLSARTSYKVSVFMNIRTNIHA